MDDSALSVETYQIHINQDFLLPTFTAPYIPYNNFSPFGHADAPGQPIELLISEFQKSQVAGICPGAPVRPNIKIVSAQKGKLKKKLFATNEDASGCQHCGAQETPEWRRGPDGIRLCNKCGLKYLTFKKNEELSKNRNSIRNILN